jgi:probable HAF family extracellular repeat protein
MQDLGALGGKSFDSEALGINASGQVVGWSDTGYSLSHAFLYTSSGGMQDLGALGGKSFDSEALAINASSQIVGYSDTSGGVEHAFLFSGGVMHDLNSLIPASSGWTLTEATAINDSGWIVGEGINSSGQEHAFLLTPTPEPSTFALLGAGAIGLITYASRRWRAR